MQVDAASNSGLATVSYTMYPEGQANARLIAAAPTMIAALKMAEAWIDQQGSLPGCRPAADAAVAVARAAIRAAEGGAA